MNGILECLIENGWVGVMLEDKYVHYEIDPNSQYHAYKFVMTPCDEDKKIENDVWFGFHKYYKTHMKISDVSDDILTNYGATEDRYSMLILDENDYPKYQKTDAYVLQKTQKIRTGVANLRKIPYKLQFVFKKEEGHFNEGNLVWYPRGFA